jgi:hypothetical protein
MPSLSLRDGESLAGRSKNSPVEKAVCERRHIIIKKLCHRVITFTPLSVAQVRLLLKVALPQPVLDLPAALALIA